MANSASPRTPDRYTSILGSAFVEGISRADHPALIIGKDSWTKHELATVLGVVQTKAASILSATCKKLGVTSTADLFKSTSPYTFAEYPAGVTTLYVMFAAFEAKGLDPEAWYARGQESAIVTFLTLKHRELQAAQRTRDDEKKRQRTARNKRHRAESSKYLANAQ